MLNKISDKGGFWDYIKKALLTQQYTTTGQQDELARLYNVGGSKENTEAIARSYEAAQKMQDRIAVGSVAKIPTAASSTVEYALRYPLQYGLVMPGAVVTAAVKSPFTDKSFLEEYKDISSSGFGAVDKMFAPWDSANDKFNNMVDKSMGVDPESLESTTSEVMSMLLTLPVGGTVSAASKAGKAGKVVNVASKANKALTKAGLVYAPIGHVTDATLQGLGNREARNKLKQQRKQQLTYGAAGGAIGAGVGALGGLGVNKLLGNTSTKSKIISALLGAGVLGAAGAFVGSRMAKGK